MKKLIGTAAIIIVGLSAVFAAEQNISAVNDKYPDLAMGCLAYAKLAELPAGILVKSDDMTISTSDVATEIGKNPKELQEQLKKYEFFLVEQIATAKILTAIAKKDAVDSNTDIKNKEDKEIIEAYFDKILQSVSVTDADVNQFYQENKDACGGAPLESIKDQIKQYVLSQKKQLAAAEYLKTMGKRQTIEVSSSWVDVQAVAIKDNPVDKARASGKPSIVDFGASGCRPCDMMSPILETLKKKYEGKLNVIFIHVREQQILASRYGIQSIPVQVFFDKDGKEVFRHIGFYPQVDIENKLTELGVKL